MGHNEEAEMRIREEYLFEERVRLLKEKMLGMKSEKTQLEKELKQSLEQK